MDTNGGFTYYIYISTCICHQKVAYTDTIITIYCPLCTVFQEVLSGHLAACIAAARWATCAIWPCCCMKAAVQHSRKPRGVAGSRSHNLKLFPTPQPLDTEGWRVWPWHQTRAGAIEAPWSPSEATLVAGKWAANPAAWVSAAYEWALPSVSGYLHANPFERSGCNAPADWPPRPQGTKAPPGAGSSGVSPKGFRRCRCPRGPGPRRWTPRDVATAASRSPTTRSTATARRCSKQPVTPVTPTPEIWKILALKPPWQDLIDSNPRWKSDCSLLKHRLSSVYPVSVGSFHGRTRWSLYCILMQSPTTSPSHSRSLSLSPLSLCVDILCFPLRIASVCTAQSLNLLPPHSIGIGVVPHILFDTDPDPEVPHPDSTVCLNRNGSNPCYVHW